MTVNKKLMGTLKNVTKSQNYDCKPLETQVSYENKRGCHTVFFAATCLNDILEHESESFQLAQKQDKTKVPDRQIRGLGEGALFLRVFSRWFFF